MALENKKLTKRLDKRRKTNGLAGLSLHFFVLGYLSEPVNLAKRLTDYTFTQRRVSADFSTASSTCWFFSPSSNVG